MKKVLVIGSTVCDVILYLDHIPSIKEDVHPKKQLFALGGCGFNTAHVIASTDTPYTFISPIGTGVFGDYIKREMAKTKVITEISESSDNGCCYCLVEESGERSFISVHGAEYFFKKEWVKNINEDEYGLGYICGLEVEDVDGSELVDYVCSSSIPFVFAPGPRILSIEKSRVDRLMDHGVILHMNDDEALSYTGCNSVEDSAYYLNNMTNNLVIITVGSKGCFYKSNESSGWVSTHNAKVVDTIGAGDAHIGAFLSAYIKDGNVKTSLLFANKVAGLVVGQEASTLSEEVYNELKNKNSDN